MSVLSRFASQSTPARQCRRGEAAMADPDQKEGDGSELTAIFARLADSLDPRNDVIDTMDLLVESAVRFTAAVEAGIILADPGGGLHIVGSTSERASDVEEAEIGIEQGPCLDSYRTGLPVETPDIAASALRWPEFARIASGRGFCSGYAVPLTLRGDTLGALNIFFDHPDALTDQDAAVFQALAEFATIGIVQRRARQFHETRASHLQHALDSRIIIEQAKGVLAFQRDITVDEAFRILRERSRSTKARLRDVAQQVVHRRVLL